MGLYMLRKEGRKKSNVNLELPMEERGVALAGCLCGVLAAETLGAGAYKLQVTRGETPKLVPKDWGLLEGLSAEEFAPSNRPDYLNRRTMNRGPRTPRTTSSHASCTIT